LKSGLKIVYSCAIGNVFESLIGRGWFEKILKNKLASKLFATEILIIGKKI